MKKLIGIFLKTALLLASFLLAVQVQAMGRAPVRSEEEIRQEQLSCEDIDLRNQLPTSLREHFRWARDQRDSNLCYAFASADLLSLEFGKPLSAFYLAIQYNRNLSAIDKAWRNVEAAFGDAQRYFPEGGYMQAALKESLHKYGVCAEELVGSQSGAKSFKAEMKNLKTLLASSRASDENFHKVESLLGLYFSDSDLLRETFVTAVNERQSVVKFLAQTANRVCRDQEKLNRRVEIVNSHEIFDFQSELVENLKQGKAVGVTYFSSLTHKEDGSETFFNKIVADHTVLAMGQRFNPKSRRCEILMRDSFGPRCDHLKSNVDCDKYSDRPTGYFWVRRDELIHNIGFYTFLKNLN